MPLLGDAKNCFVGQTQIKQIYAGTQLVWPPGPDINADIQFLAHFDKESNQGLGGQIALLGPWTDGAIASFVPERLDNDGKFGKCTTFNHAESRINVSFNPVLSAAKSLTIDFWLNLNDISVTYDTTGICGVYGTPSNDMWFALRCVSSTLSLFCVKNNSISQELNVGRIVSGWNHIAMTIYVSSTEAIAKGFLNGVTNGISVDELVTDFTAVLAELGGVSQNKPGYKIDELRISEGLRYTGDFTPPTEPYYPDDT